MPLDITIREVAKGLYHATYVDPENPSVTYILTTFDRKRIPSTIAKMVKERKDRLDHPEKEVHRLPRR
jgi:hypothetical protein